MRLPYHAAVSRFQGPNPLPERQQQQQSQGACSSPTGLSQNTSVQATGAPQWTNRPAPRGVRSTPTFGTFLCATPQQHGHHERLMTIGSSQQTASKVPAGPTTSESNAPQPPHSSVLRTHTLNEIGQCSKQISHNPPPRTAPQIRKPLAANGINSSNANAMEMQPLERSHGPSVPLVLTFQRQLDSFQNELQNLRQTLNDIAISNDQSSEELKQLQDKLAGTRISESQQLEANKKSIEENNAIAEQCEKENGFLEEEIKSLKIVQGLLSREVLLHRSVLYKRQQMKNRLTAIIHEMEYDFKTIEKRAEERKLKTNDMDKKLEYAQLELQSKYKKILSEHTEILDSWKANVLHVQLLKIVELSSKEKAPVTERQCTEKYKNLYSNLTKANVNVFLNTQEFFEEDDIPPYAIYNQSNVLCGCSINKLIYLITTCNLSTFPDLVIKNSSKLKYGNDDNTRQKELIKTVLLTFRTFTTIHEFFIKLAKRYMQAGTVSDFGKDKEIKNNVLNVIISWGENFSTDFKDPILKELVLLFCYNILTTKTEIDSIAKFIEKQQKFANIIDHLNSGSSNRTKDIKFIKLKSEQIVQQCALLGQELFKNITFTEFSHPKNWSEDPQKNAPNVFAFTQHFNRLVLLAQETILQADKTDRAKALKFVFDGASKALEINDFVTFLAFMNAIKSPQIARLKKLNKNFHSSLNSKEEKNFEKFNILTDAKGNFKTLLDEMNSATPPLVPFLGAYQVFLR